MIAIAKTKHVLRCESADECAYNYCLHAVLTITHFFFLPTREDRLASRILRLYELQLKIHQNAHPLAKPVGGYLQWFSGVLYSCRQRKVLPWLLPNPWLGHSWTAATTVMDVPINTDAKNSVYAITYFNLGESTRLMLGVRSIWCKECHLDDAHLLYDLTAQFELAVHHNLIYHQFRPIFRVWE